MAKIKDKKTGEIREGNKPFIQFYKHSFGSIIKLVEDNKLAARLFFYLTDLMDSKNALVISQQLLAKELKVTRMSIYTATQYLVKHKYIKIVRSGGIPIYCINADIVWTQRADKKVFAKFDATVYVAAEEQDKEEQGRIELEYQKLIKGRKGPKKFKTNTNEVAKFEEEKKKGAS